MSKSSQTLNRILAIERILLNNPYGVTINEIISVLENEYGIKSERKTIYENVKVLSRFMNIGKFTGNRRSNVYYIKEEAQQ